MDNRSLSGVLLLGAAGLLAYAWLHGMLGNALNTLTGAVQGSPTLAAPTLPKWGATTPYVPGTSWTR
jgi:hypothetical protein